LDNICVQISMQMLLVFIISRNRVLYKNVKTERVKGFKLLTDSQRCRFWFSNGKVAANNKPDSL